jgi:hypothetical protein
MLDEMLYNPIVKYKKGSKLTLPGTLSRGCDLAGPGRFRSIDMTEEIYRKMFSETLSENKLMSKCLKKYYTLREELGAYNGLFFKGSRVIIPESMKKYALQLSHVGHNGVQQPVRRAKDAMCSYAS